MDKYKDFGVAALNRAMRTFAQTALALIGTDARGYTDLDWPRIALTAGVAALVSVLTSVFTDLPEVGGAQLGVGGNKADGDDKEV